MPPGFKAPHRGDILSINTNPVAGREMRDRHYWIVLTPEPVNKLGLAICVVVSTAAEGARAAGLTVRVVADGVTGVAICTQVRSFDLMARLQDGSATRASAAPADVVDEIAARIASLIEPTASATPPTRAQAPKAEPAGTAAGQRAPAKLKGRKRE